MKGISRRQLDVLRVIGRQIQLAGISPTMREIAEKLGTVKHLYCITEHLERLVHKGYLTRQVRMPRSAVPTPEGWALLMERGCTLSEPPRNDVEPVSANDVEPTSDNDVSRDAGAGEVACPAAPIH